MSAQVQFVDQYGAEAQRASAALGIPASWVLGQWGLETGWGQSFAGLNNPGNIQGAAARPYDFPSLSSGVDAYVNTLQSGRYSGALAAGSPLEFGQGLKAGGYAADPDYAVKIGRVIGDVVELAGEDADQMPSGDASWLERNVFGPVKAFGFDLGFLVLGVVVIGAIVWQSAGSAKG